MSNSPALESCSSLYNFHTNIHVLRLDQLHPVVSGNKIFKLTPYLEEAAAKLKRTLLTFGGAFSNHLVATAAAAQMRGWKSIGIVRGEPGAEPSPTLQDATAFGMKLYHVSREAYRHKEIPPIVYGDFSEAEIQIIPEGGYGIPGRIGAASIMDQKRDKQFTHVFAAVGTGTTLAGLAVSAHEKQTVIGIPVLKNLGTLPHEIDSLIDHSTYRKYQLIDNYQCGGYARYTPDLLDFMNQWFLHTAIPTDFVYTGKLFYAVNDLVRKDFFPKHAKILVIHSGGLQGNRSLPKGTLIF